MSDYTPGPWIAHGSRIASAAGEPICDVVHSVPHDGKRFDANRNLIVAAPDMLEALKAVRDHGFTRVTTGVAALVNGSIDKAEGR